MAGEPVIELIARNIETLIDSITTGNGYYQTLNARRPTRDIFEDIGPLVDKDVLVVQDDPQLSSDNPHGAQEWTQPFLLSIVLQDSDGATTSIDQRKNYAMADVIKALMIDPTRGGYAIDTNIADVFHFPAETNETGITVVANVLYRTSYNNPYTNI